MKNRNIVHTLFALASLALLTTTAQAHDRDEPHGAYNAVAPLAQPVEFGERHDRVANVEARQNEQMQRIRAGIERGQITRQEARYLMREQREIEQTERAYLADGRLTHEEWLSLDHLLDRADADIRAERHDRDWR